MTLANKITIVRIFLIPVFIILLVYGYQRDNLAFQQISILIFLVCAITDAIDGMIARRFKQKTELGSFLDPLADKLLLTTAFFLLAYFEKISLGVVIVVISRDVLLGLGWIILHVYTSGPLVIQPSLFGKGCTFFQITVVILCLLGVPRSSEIRYILITIMVVLTVASILDYIIKGSKRFNHNHPELITNKGEQSCKNL